MKNMKNNIEKKLKNANVAYQFIPLPADLPADVPSHAKFHGIGLEQATQTLIFRTEIGLVAVQKCANADIDNKKLRQFLGVKRLNFASQTDLDQLGLTVGLVPLTGFDLPFVVDQRVLEVEEAYGSGGDKLFGLKLKPADLVKINQARVGNVTSLKEGMSSSIQNKR